MESLQELTEQLKKLDLSIDQELLDNATDDELIELMEILTEASVRIKNAMK